MNAKYGKEDADGALPMRFNLRRVMFTAAGILLLVLLCAAPAAASAADAVVFGGGTFETADELADKLGSENATADGGTLTLLTDLNITGPINITGEMTILGAGHTIWRGGTGFHLINVTGSDGNLTLGSDENSKLTIDGQGEPFEGRMGLITVTSGGNLTMNSGVTLTNSRVRGSGAGGGVSVYTSSTFTLSGGTISGNTGTAGSQGVGVFVNSASTFTMSGGTISGNTGIYAGGVHVDDSTFTMSGGEISNNTAFNDGGGMRVLNGQFTMSGGTISGNTAGTNAGGVEVYDGTFTMSGGEISNNTATKGRGGGVAMTYAAVFTMSGGEISGNTAKKGGGVDVLTGGTFTLSGGTISDNTATEYGGVYLSTHEIRDLILELSNVTFRNNKDTSGTTNTAIRLDIYSTSPSSTYKYSLAGATSFGNDQALSISYLPEDGIHIKDGFTGSLKQLVLDNESLDGKTIFTIDDTAGGTASELLPRFTLADTRKWTLAADDAGKKIVGTLNKPVALSGAENVAVEWINATIANVSIRLDPNANDATDVHVKLGENPSQTVSGTFAKGSTISGLQVTGLTAGSTYSVTAVLKNSGISEKEFTSDPLLEVTAPVPDRVVITGEGGAEITGDSITIGHGTSATFGARVYNGSLLLKDEPVTWEKVDDDNGHLTLSDQTATTVNVTGVSATSPDEPKLKATAGKNPSANKAVTILVSDAEITAIAVTPTIAAVETGAAAQITITATDADSKNRAGEPITWELDPGLIRTGGDTSGTTAAFTAAAAGTYTATAKLTSDTTKTADVTITVVGKPAITAQPQSATYTKGQAEADPLTVSATAPGSQALTYQWQKSTDPTFAADVSTVGSDAASYTPDISSAGTFYYRANVTYTESGITTWTHSSAAKITVLEPTADSITLSPGDTSVTIQKGNAAQITATAKNSTLDRVLDSASIVWAVQSGAAYASITQNGNQVTITGNNGGTAVITATSGTAVARVTVIVNDPAKTTHTITATAGSGGSISPAGAIPVVEGQGQAFDIIPNPGYIVRDVKVDGASVGAITYYSFANVKETHTISAEFSEASFTITATAGAGGSISPSGAVTVPAGESRTFTITPDAGNTIADVIVDGASVGARGSYTFSSVYEGHTIAAAFQQAPTPTPPRPTPSGGGDGYSSTDSGSVSATGQVSFGTTTGVTDISFAKGTSGTVTINTKPTGVTAPANSYTVVDITGPVFEGYAQIEFSVPVAVLTDNGYTVNDITLQHYTGGQWVRLDTTYLGEERGAAKYVAATRSFSPFAIVYEKGGAPTIEKATPEPTGSTTARPTVQETSGETRPTSGVQNTPAATTAAPDDGTPVPTLTQAPAPVFGALAGLLAAGVLFRRRE